MTCHEFQSRLDAAIAARDSAEIARLAVHGEACATETCRAAWQDGRFLNRAIAAWRTADRMAAPHLAERVLSELASERDRPSTRDAALVNSPTSNRSGLHWLSISIAAALLVAVGFLARPAPDARQVATRPQPADPFRPEQPTQLANVPDEPQRESYVELAHEATYFMTDLAILVVPVDVDDPAEDSGSDWLSRLGEKLEPVRTGVEGKLGEWFSPPAT